MHTYKKKHLSYQCNCICLQTIVWPWLCYSVKQCACHLQQRRRLTVKRC